MGILMRDVYIKFKLFTSFSLLFDLTIFTLFGITYISMIFTAAHSFG
jgi:hypothetical protein